MTHRRYRASSWLDPRLVIQDSPLGGLGTFTTAPIDEGEIVIVWSGVLMTDEDLRSGNARPGSIAAIGEGIYLAGRAGDPPEPADFLNHSCDSNLWMQDEVTLSTRRAIAASEELTGDYVLWEADETRVSPWACRCGAPSCRVRVTGRDWRLPALQTHYRRHFSPFVNARMATERGAT